MKTKNKNPSLKLVSFRIEPYIWNEFIKQSEHKASFYLRRYIKKFINNKK